MAIFPVLIRIESPALGDVLQTLHKFPGVIDFKILFDGVPGPKGGPRKRLNGHDTHDEETPSISTRIINALAEHGDLHLKQLESLLEGVPKQSISATLTEMKKSGITEQRGMGVHALTKEARDRLGAKAKDAVLAMPKPDNKGQGADIIRGRLTQGPAKRSELAGLLVTNNLAASSIQTILNKMIERGEVETTERAIYQLKTTPTATPAAPAAKVKTRTILLDYFKAHGGVARRTDIIKETGLPISKIASQLKRLGNDGIVETVSAGLYKFTKDAAKKLQAKSTKE